MQIFEELSGSVDLKPQCEKMKLQISECDNSIKLESESLQALRMEKVK